MIIDAHSHILALAADPDFTVDYGREGSLCIYRSMGKLPSHRMPTEQEWEASGMGRTGWPLIGPAESRRDHPGFDKIVVLAVSPQYPGRQADRHGGHRRHPRGRRAAGPGECNDYIAAVVARTRSISSASPRSTRLSAGRRRPWRSWSARYRPRPGRLKLYPMYQHWAANDRDLAFPIYRRAADLGIPVMIHQAGSTAHRRQAGTRPARHCSTTSGANSATCGSSSRTAGCRGWTRPCSC